MTIFPRASSASSGNGVAAARVANLGYFPALDGFRAVAFLMVFSQHYLQMTWGFMGVDVFFVLSGFLITGILYDTRDQVHRVRNFYVRRTLRIFPLYYGLMLLLVFSYPYFRWQWTWAWLVWPAYLGNFCRGIHPYANGSGLQMLADFSPVSRQIDGFRLSLGHFWSLCMEEQFYLVWPWVVFCIRDRKKLLYVCMACLVICPMARVVGSHTLPQFMLDQQVLYRWTPFRVDALLLGGLVALLRRGSKRGLLPGARVGIGMLVTIALAYLSYGFLHRHQNLSLSHVTWGFTWGILYVDLFSACLIVTALEVGSVTFRIFNMAPLRWLGRISYGAYVFHDIFHPEIVAMVERFTGKVPGQYSGSLKYGTATVALIFTVLISWASFRWFETPFIRLKERWTRPVRDFGQAG